MDGGDLLLALRVALSLACVLGLLWYLNRKLSGGGKGTGLRRRPQAMTVVGRQSLGGKNGLAVVEVDGRRLLLGVGERGVSLLTELEPVAEAVAEADAVSPVGRATSAPAGPAVERIELDPAELEKSLKNLVPPSTPAARKPAVPKPRNPLEGSILDAATWRQAVVAVQERTLRH